jgi:hypothetical protein
LGNCGDHRFQHWDVQQSDFRSEFLIFCPARYAVRLSRAFIATDAVKVVVDEVININDICTLSDGKYQPFTDGVGTCSKELSRNIWAQLKTFPSTASKAESSTIRSTLVSNLVSTREYIFSENSCILWLLEWNNAGNARSSAAEGTQISTKTSMQE